jgi:hypothetical protein
VTPHTRRTLVALLMLARHATPGAANPISGASALSIYADTLPPAVGASVGHLLGLHWYLMPPAQIIEAIEAALRAQNDRLGR